jgi:hypothetical protein
VIGRRIREVELFKLLIVRKTNSAVNLSVHKDAEDPVTAFQK